MQIIRFTAVVSGIFNSAGWQMKSEKHFISLTNFAVSHQIWNIHILCIFIAKIKWHWKGTSNIPFKFTFPEISASAFHFIAFYKWHYLGRCCCHNKKGASVWICVKIDSELHTALGLHCQLPLLCLCVFVIVKGLTLRTKHPPAGWVLRSLICMLTWALHPRLSIQQWQAAPSWPLPRHRHTHRRPIVPPAAGVRGPAGCRLLLPPLLLPPLHRSMGDGLRAPDQRLTCPPARHLSQVLVWG